MILVGNESSPFFYYHFGFSFGFKIVACFREFFVAQHGSTEAMICYFPSSSDIKPQEGSSREKTKIGPNAHGDEMRSFIKSETLFIKNKKSFF